MILPNKKSKQKKKTLVNPLDHLLKKGDKSDYSNIAFIHMPKTAGTSISRSFPYLGNNFMYDIYRPHRTAKDLQSQNIHLEKMFTFTFVRNPYDRFVSFYHYFLDRVDKFALSNMVYKRLQDKDFSSFCLFLPKFLHRYPAAYLFFRPQYLYIEGFKPNFIGRYENLQKDWKRLLITIKNKTTLVPNLKTQLLHRKKSNHTNYKQYYNTKTQRAIYRFYQKDFEIFGYDKDL